MRLLKKLNLKQYCNELHFTLIAIILLFLSFKYYFVFIFYGIYVSYLIIKKKKLFLLIVLSLYFSIFQIYLVYKEHKVLQNNLTITIVENGDNHVIGYYKNYKVLLYTDNEFNCGDVIECNTSIVEIEDKSYPEDFDLKSYYSSKGIYHVYHLNDYVVINNRATINTLRYKLSNYYSKVLSEECFIYVKALFLGQNDFDDSLKDSYSLLGISHILAISGLHINMLYTALVFLFRRIFRIHYDTVPIFIIAIYVFIIGFPVSCLRALIYLIIKSYDSGRRLKFTRLDILTISFIAILLVMPYCFFQTSFILTFLVSFLLCFSSDLIRTKSALINAYLTYILVFLITLPVVTEFNNYLSLTSILLSPILTIVASFVLIPLSFILALPFGWILNAKVTPLFELFSQFTIKLSRYSIGLSLPSFNLVTVLIYYVIYFIILFAISSKRPYIRYALLLIVYILLLQDIAFIDPFNRITFIDGGQGDSTLISLKNNGGVILIDCYNSYEYLRKKAVDKIDYLILTHSDNDHINDIDLILDGIEVDKIIAPIFDDGFISYTNRANIIYVKSDDIFSLKSIKINILSPSIDLENKNANSLALSFELDGYKYLFTGDINAAAEDIMISTYKDKLKANVLKVAHHGSSTSSSSKFINIVNPDYSIIFAKKNNIYGFPNNSVLARLNNTSVVFQTGLCGNIYIESNNKNFKIRGYRN